jgi:hypothetical protein
MYRVSYYMSSSSTLSTKLFATLSEALKFSVYSVTPGWNVHQITKVEE